MIKGKTLNVSHRLPYDIIMRYLQAPAFTVDQRKISCGNHPAGGVAVNVAKRMYLFKIYIVQTGTLLQHPVGCFFQVLVGTYQVAQQGIETFEFFQVRLNQEHFKFVIVVAENHTVNRYGNLKIILVASPFKGCIF